MTESEFESALSIICEKLKLLSFDKPFRSASEFEIQVREVTDEVLGPGKVDFSLLPRLFLISRLINMALKSNLLLTIRGEV
jgi:hypothetical protein